MKSSLKFALQMMAIAALFCVSGMNPVEAVAVAAAVTVIIRELDRLKSRVKKLETKE